MTPDATLDCYGLLCPMPIVRTAQKLREMKVGETLEVISTDPGIEADMPAWCRTTGQEFMGLAREGEIIKVYIRKARD
jgi:tRNA 2-thiouridine synthesizing protein A